jgi:hypothetical protein
MSTLKSPSATRTCLDLWNLFLILVGVLIVLLIRPIAGCP